MILSVAVATVTLVVCAVMVVRVAQSPQIGFREGVAVGFVYFIGGPVLQLLLLGQVAAPDLGIPPLELDDAADTLTYIAASSFVTWAVLACSRRSGISLTVDDSGTVRGRGLAKIHLALYVVAASYVFVKSGKYLGNAHWMEVNEDLYAGSAAAVVVGNFYNVLRVTVPAVLVFSYFKLGCPRARVLLVLIAFAVIELVISSNRILVLFALLGALMIYRHKWRRFVICAALVAPVLLHANAVFPMVRGLFWQQTPSIATAVDVIGIALSSHSSSEDSLGQTMTAAFESANLQVVDFVARKFGSDVDYLVGETIFLKSLTFFLPRVIWESKPAGFNTRIGYQVSGSHLLALNATLLGESYGNFGLLGLLVFGLVMMLFQRAFAGFRDPLVQFCGFFVALAAWRFEFSFLLIGLFVLACVNAISHLRASPVFRRSKQGLVTR